MTQKVLIYRFLLAFTHVEPQTISVLTICCYLDNKESAKEEERSYGSMMMERLTGSPDGRVDHVLQVITLL